MFPISDFSASNEECAIAVGVVDGDYCHCGILYKRETKSFFLHLGNPAALYNSTNDSGDYGYLKHNLAYKWKPFLNVPSEVVGLITTHCALIADCNHELPYGLFYEENSFFDDKGKFHIEDSTGLTCATFVKTVLKACALEIINDPEWPIDRKGDLRWVKHLKNEYTKIIVKFEAGITVMKIERKKNEGNEEAVKFYTEKIEDLENKIEKFKGCIIDCNDALGSKSLLRYRPEEISGTSYHEYEELALTFPPAEKLGQEVLKILKA